jgi:4,5-dihydroxyphthalate decarboxylase
MAAGKTKKLKAPQAEARRCREKHKAIPVNHLLVMGIADVRADPNAALEVWRDLKQSKSIAPARPQPDRHRAEPPKPQMIADRALRQNLIPHQISVDEMLLAD